MKKTVIVLAQEYRTPDVAPYDLEALKVHVLEELTRARPVIVLPEGAGLFSFVLESDGGGGRPPLTHVAAVPFSPQGPPSLKIATMPVMPPATVPAPLAFEDDRRFGYETGAR